MRFDPRCRLRRVDRATAPPGSRAGCIAQGAPTDFEQANTQITTFTGGNPDLEPEESDSYTVGVVYSPSWAEDQAWSDRFDFELNYYNHEIDGAIQARDLQSLLEACLREGGVGTLNCAAFTRNPIGGNLNPPNNFLDNLGTIKTDGVDVKFNWIGPEWSWGRLNASLQSTLRRWTTKRSTSTATCRSVRSASKSTTARFRIGRPTCSWAGRWETGTSTGPRATSPRSTSPAATCRSPRRLVARAGSQFNTLGSTTYHDLQVSWKNAFALEGLKLSVGANNVFGKEPPVCLTCSLNGYDAGTYDLPGAFWYVSADYRF